MRRLIAIIVLIGGLTAEAQVWSPLDGGLQGTPTAITSIGKLVATAHIAGYKDGYRIHQLSIWNGFYWVRLPALLADSNSVIRSLEFYGGALYAAGKIDSVRGLKNAKHIVRWKNREFQALPQIGSSSTSFSPISKLEAYKNQLLIFGPFNHNAANYGNNVLFFNGASVVNVSPNYYGSGIKGLITTAFSNDDLLAIGGRFTQVKDTLSTNLAIYSNQGWTRVEKNPFVPTHLTVLNGEIYFSGLEPKTKTLGFYKLDQGQIDTIDNGLIHVGEVFDLVAVGDNMYASGQFYFDSDNDPINLIVYNGGRWRPLANGDLLGLRLLAIHQGSLVATGYFTYHDQLKYNHIAKYKPDYGIIAGTIFFDKDDNCELTKRDERLSEMNLYIQPGGHLIQPQEDGTFMALLPKGNYSVKILNNKLWEPPSCGSGLQSVNLTKDDIRKEVNFPMIQKIGIRDLAVKLRSISGIKVDKNGTVSYAILVKNNGSEDVSSTHVVLHHDALLTNFNSKLPPVVQQGDSVVWNISNFYAGEQIEIVCSFSISDNTAETIELTASVPLQATEQEVDDNNAYLLQYLSEDDYEFKKEIIPAGVDTAYISDSTSFLEYQISFANLTADTIHTVYVIDTIRLNHSLTVIQTTGASHTVSSQAFTGLPGEDIGVIVWTFENIELMPNPNNNPEIVEHKGYISFKIGLNHTLAQGTVLENKADVVFDYYEEAPTNWVYALVDNQLAHVPKLNFEQSVGVYPNPAHDKLFLKADRLVGAAYSIWSQTGKAVDSGTASSYGIAIDQLPPGVYMLQLVKDGQLHSSRFIKI